MTDIPYKQCSKCHQWLPATTEFFSRSKRQKSGLCPSCKACNSARGKQYYQAHRDEVLARQKRYHESNKEEYYAYRERYRGEYERERSARRRQQEKHRLYHKQYKEAHREQSIEYLRQYRKDNGTTLNAKKKEYLRTDKGMMVGRTHSGRRRAQKKAQRASCTTQQLQEQLARQKRRCYYCSARLGNSYHVDHVVPLSRGGAHDISNIVIACPSCNLSKNDKLPHEFFQGGKLL